VTTALDTGQLTASETAEVVVQAVPYVRLGRTDASAQLTADVLAESEARLRLHSPTTVTATTAVEAGPQVQRDRDPARRVPPGSPQTSPATSTSAMVAPS
jgi:hypothetical protein